MSCGIYKITNIQTNDCYIGQSTNIERRWQREKTCPFNKNDKSYNSILSKAIRKYGIQNFQFEILELCEPSNLDYLEQQYIQQFDSYYNGYNATMGGQAGTSHIEIKISKEQLLEIYDLLINSSLPQKEIALRYNVGQDIISTINHGKSRRIDGYQYPLRDNHSVKKYCCDCGIEISYKALRCDKCEKLRQRKVERPNREELKSLIRAYPFTQLGKKYNVSDKTISKWCESYNLPSKKKEIKKYTNQEWLDI